MPAEQMPRIRRTPIPPEAVLVVRGDELHPEVLEADARRFRRRFGAWGRFGISAFLASDDDEVDALCETKLRQWQTVAVFERDELEGAGIDIVPTFRTPHVTLAHAEVHELVRRIIHCGHSMIINPYYESGEGPTEIR